MFWTVFSFNQSLGEHNGIIILSERGCYYLGKKKKKSKKNERKKHSRGGFGSFMKINTMLFCIHEEV